MMELPITGGCFCGALRYQVDQQPFSQANCHCRSCQHATGGAYAPVLLVATRALKIEGEYKEYLSKGDSGHDVTRGFCGQCGTTVFAHTTRIKGMRPIYAITMDHPEQFKPELEAWLDFAQPWVCLDESLPQYRRDLPAEAAGLPPPAHRR